MVKINISKEELYDFYIKNNMTVSEIANMFKVSKSCIETRLKKYNIKKDKKLWAENYKKAIFDKYGVDNISQLQEIKQKKKNIFLQKYGVDNPNKIPEAKQKRKETSVKKYGVDNPMKSDKIKEKIKENNLKKYGVEWSIQRKETRKKINETMIQRYGASNFSRIKEIKNKMINTNIDKYGVPYACMTEQCRNANGYTRSKINSDFSKKLKKVGVENSQEFNIGRYSFDIKLKESDILIEINPTYTHNSTVGINFRNHYKEPTEKEYHYNKTKVAKENGYRCIHIFDWDDEEKIVEMLKPKQKIYARNLDCKEVTKEEATEFLNKYHLQGNCKGQSVIIGLFKDNELLEIMSFGKPRYNKKYEWELLRLCSNNNYNIIGGANRLFTHFLIAYNPKSIISYCDNSKFDGNVYRWLGFDLLNYGKPGKHWYNVKTKQHITDNLLRQRGFDQLFGTNYGKGTSNKDLMIENGFVEIYDCGQSTYVYERN